MKIIDMPTSPNFVKSSFKLNRMTGSVVSPYTGKVRTQEYDGVFWTGTVSLPPMRRHVARQWQSFLMQCNGPVNNFKFADPDALIQQGTFTGTHLQGERRVNETSATLSFTASTNTIAGASNTTYFTNVNVGDFIVVTGSTKVVNNGTHKVLTKANAYTVTVSPNAAESLEDESNKSGCKIQQNIKGATGLSLKAIANANAGTILQGDYIGISNSTSNNPSSYTPIQYVMAVSNATETNNGGSALNQYSVKIEPKLRKDFVAATDRVYINPAKGLFRLSNSDVEWDADNISNYGIAFSVVEVV